MTLPDFLVIGAMKAGTTTLYERLRRHPQVGMSRLKETDFLIGGRNWERGLDWYRGQFEPGRQAYGEASPNYTKKEAFPGVPERAARVVPHARLVFIARDPVERANSQYRHAVLSGVALPPPDRLAGTRHLRHLIETSSYAAQLDPWIERFGRDRLLVLRFEALAAEPAPELSRLAAFLGVADEWPEAGGAANTADSLARLPPWLFALRGRGPGAWLRDRLPPDLRGRLKGMVARGDARDAPGLTPAVRAEIADALAEDAARFRAIAGTA